VDLEAAPAERPDDGQEGPCVASENQNLAWTTAGHAILGSAESAAVVTIVFGERRAHEAPLNRSEVRFHVAIQTPDIIVLRRAMSSEE
jgi:hypothetical protein